MSLSLVAAQGIGAGCVRTKGRNGSAGGNVRMRRCEFASVRASRARVRSRARARARGGTAMTVVGMPKGYTFRAPFKQPGDAYYQWVDVWNIFVRHRALLALNQLHFLHIKPH